MSTTTTATITELSRKAARLPSPPPREFYGEPPANPPTPVEYIRLHAQIDALLDQLTGASA